MKLFRPVAIGVLAIAATTCGNRPAPVAQQAVESSTTAAEAAEKKDAVDLSAESQRRLGVVSTPVTEESVAVVLRVTGSVQPVDARVAHIRPLGRARILQVQARLGDQVSAGQALATVDSIEAGELSAQYDAAAAELGRLRARLGTVAKQVERDRLLVDRGVGAAKDYEASRGEQQELEQSIRGQEDTIAAIAERLKRFGVTDLKVANRSRVTSIVAPFAGVVTMVKAGPGEIVDAASEVFSLADMSRLYVEAQVYEKDLAQVRKGQKAMIRTDAYPNKLFTGQVVSIGDTIDPQTRAATVRCEVTNSERLLKLNMFATVELPTQATKSTLAVPVDSVQSLEGKPVVFVRVAPTRFEIRTVEVGRTAEGLVEISRGLKIGEQVVTRNAFQLKSARLSKELGEKE